MLHIGAKDMVDDDHILVILDLSSALSSKETRAFLNHAKKHHRVIGSAIKSPKSVVVACDKQGVKIIYSQVSASTLRGRLNAMNY